MHLLTYIPTYALSLKGWEIDVRYFSEAFYQNNLAVRKTVGVSDESTAIRSQSISSVSTVNPLVVVNTTSMEEKERIEMLLLQSRIPHGTIILRLYIKKK
jgi:hypothetical protein